MKQNVVQAVAVPAQVLNARLDFAGRIRVEQLQSLGRPECVCDQVARQELRVRRLERRVFPGDE